MVRALVLLGVVGCYDPHAPASVRCGPSEACPAGQRCVGGVCDPGAGGDAATDDAPDGELVFGAPQRVAELASTNEDFGTTLAAGDAIVVINSDRVGNHRLWVATRAAADQPFGLMTPVVGTDMAGGLEYDAELSEDALELLYHSTVNRPGLRRVTRQTLDAAWSAPEVLPEGRDRDGPSLALGDLRLFVSGATDGGIEEYARGARDQPWTLVRAHPALGTARWPAIRADALEIFVVEDRANQPPRLVRATRTSIDDAFGAPQRVTFPGLGNAAVADPELAADGTLYLSIEVDGDFDIYRATR